MKAFEELVHDLFREATKVVAVGLPAPLQPPFELEARFPEHGPYDGALWTGPSEQAIDAARSASRCVREGGSVVLSSQTRASALSAVRALFSSHDTQRDHVEDLCGALLAAGLEHPELIVESPSLIVARGFVRGVPRAVF